MLANGTKLEYKKKSDAVGSFKVLTGLKSIPEMGTEPEKIENTCLTDTVKQYELGIGDAGELAYTFKYENSSATSPYRVLREAEKTKEVLTFKETLFDGTVYQYDAQVSVKRGGGGVNEVLEFTLNMALQSDIVTTDPV